MGIFERVLKDIRCARCKMKKKLGWCPKERAKAQAAIISLYMNQRDPPILRRTDKVGREWLAYVLRENGYSPVWDDNYKHGVKFGGKDNGDVDQRRSESVQMETDSKVCRGVEGVDYSDNRTSDMGEAESDSHPETGRSMELDSERRPTNTNRTNMWEGSEEDYC